MSQPTAQHGRWSPLRDRQRAAVVEAVLVTVARGDAVTVAELAEQAGMSRPTFYKYFPTLGAAMLHTHRHVLGALEEYIARRLADPAQPAVDRLLATFDLTFEYTRANRDVLRFFSYFDFTFRRFGLSADERDELERIVAGSGDRTRELFVEGRADGSIDASLPIDQTIMALSGSVTGLAQRLLIQDEYADVEDDDRARAAHDLVMAAWRLKLRGSLSA